MQKKCYMILSVLVLLVSFLPLKVQAGTFVVGAKTWYETTWDSAVLDIYKQLFTDSLRKSDEIKYENIEYETFTGNGYLAGPVIGYQTDDAIWSFSFAAMVLSHFNQEVRGSALATEAFGIVPPDPFRVIDHTTVDVDRTDYDFTASYSLSSFKDKLSFLRYWKVFLGFKYQDVDYDFTFHTKIESGALSIPNSGTTSIDYEVYMPTLGIAFVYPFTEHIAVGIQGGAGVAHFEGYNAKDGFAFNVEGNFNIEPINNLIIQLGYRYQEFRFETDFPAPEKNYNATDKTYGPTLTIAYTF